MEKVKSAFPEDAAQVAKELDVLVLQLLVSLLFANFVHQLIDIICSFVGVGPFSHLDGEF